MNSRLLNIGFSLVAVAIMSGCGGSDAVDAASDAADSIADAVKDAAVDYGCETTNTANGVTYTQKIGADGKLAVECTDGGGNIILANDANELIIEQVKVTGAIDVTVDGATVQGVVQSDLNAGTMKYTGTHSTEGTFDCTETYDVSDAVKTINDGEQIWDLIWFDDDSSLLSTDCPKWFDDDNEDDEKGTFVLNAVITDVDGGTSNLTEYTEVK